MIEQANAKQGTEKRKRPLPSSRIETNDEVTSGPEFMESRFGYDFGNVRIHTCEEAAESAIWANALATGRRYAGKRIVST